MMRNRRMEGISSSFWRMMGTMMIGWIMIMMMMIMSSSKSAMGFGISSSSSSSTTMTNHHRQMSWSMITRKMSTDNEQEDEPSSLQQQQQSFDLTTALFCSGFAFDAYAEPPANSSRWERGSSGLNVAFQSAAYTRSLYRGMVEVTPVACKDLPDEDDTAEGVLTGGGVDASMLVAIAEGKWKEDLEIIEKSKYHDGIYQLGGAAHVGKSSTVWSNINQNKATAQLKRGEGTGSYHIPSGWGKGGQAIFGPKEPSFYLYVQDPSTARLVFTVMDDDVVGKGSPIGSASRKLTELFSMVSEDQLIQTIKDNVLARIQRGEEVDLNDEQALLESVIQQKELELKLTTKPRIKDKKGQVATGAAIGATVAGPVGAAVGGLIGNFYEGEVRGRIEAHLRFIPIPSSSTKQRIQYQVKGGLPGVNWGGLYEQHLQKVGAAETTIAQAKDDLEFCFFINHDKTGCSCALYRSLEQKLILLSFRGTCELIDLVTDASILQTTWIEGDDVEKEDVAKVHVGFRNSMNSISRRLKELMLAAVKPGEDISEYDVLVTGHSLGGALATLFTADIGEYGIDAGRGLPQLEASDDWWKSLASNFLKDNNIAQQTQAAPPRPKSLKMYNFGSPRVGNDAFVARFDALMNGNGIDEAYRLVNGQDAVARMPRTVNALALGSIGYNHCAPTALVNTDPTNEQPRVWVEGESDNRACPVRDGTPLTSPLASGSLLGDILSAVDNDSNEEGTEKKEKKLMDYVKDANKIADAMKGRLGSLTAADLTSIVGIDKSFAEREANIIKSIFSGEALSHHMEDQYYLAMGRAGGFATIVGEEIQDLEQ